MLTLEVKPTPNKSKLLVYENKTIIAKGEEKVMINLKNALEELLVDKLIKQRINEYKTLDPATFRDIWIMQPSFNLVCFKTFWTFNNSLRTLC